MRAWTAVRRIISASGLAAAALAVAGLCVSAAFEPVVSRDEVARVASPSGGDDAVLHELNGGATMSFACEVRIVAAGASAGKDIPPVAVLYGATRNPSAYGVNLRWRDGGTLVVEYFDAKSARLDRPRLESGGRTVNVVLRSGVSDPEAPPGGMLYNLRNARRR